MLRLLLPFRLLGMATAPTESANQVRMLCVHLLRRHGLPRNSESDACIRVGCIPVIVDAVMSALYRSSCDHVPRKELRGAWD